MSGRTLPDAMMMMIPEAWQKHNTMDDAKRAFYEYQSTLMEPWDGPASIAFTDGRCIGAILDRNGLRPSRYYLTTDDRVIMASEVGVLPVEAGRIREKGRLQPGRMFLVDFQQGRLIPDLELKRERARVHTPTQPGSRRSGSNCQNSRLPGTIFPDWMQALCCRAYRPLATRARACSLC